VQCSYCFTVVFARLLRQARDETVFGFINLKPGKFEPLSRQSKNRNPNAILIRDCNSRQANMPPPKKPLKSVYDAKKGNNTVMSHYFKRKSLGRRPKAHALCTDDVGAIVIGRKKRGPVPGAARKKNTKTKMAAIVGDGGLEELCPSLLKTLKVQRVNWGAGEPLQRLTEALNDWDSSTDSALDTIGHKLSLRSFVIAAVGISASTLMAYVRKDNKRSNPGDSAGQPPLLNARNQGFIRNVLDHKDRANEGANYQDAVVLVQELDPKLTQEQSRHHPHELC
jgi:hypothetical protein